MKMCKNRTENNINKQQWRHIMALLYSICDVNPNIDSLRIRIRRQSIPRSRGINVHDAAVSDAAVVASRRHCVHYKN